MPADLFARIARLEEYVASARLQGPFASVSGGRPSASAMTHIAEVASDGRIHPDTGRTLEAGGAGGTSRSPEMGRPVETGRNMETGRGAAAESSRPAETRRTAEPGRTAESARTAAPAGRTTFESGRTAPGAGAGTARPSESSRTTTERSHTMETRDPNGSPPRRADPQPRRPGDYDPTIHRTEERRNGTSLGWLWALPLAALAGLGLYFLLPTERDTTPVTATREAVQPTRDTAAITDPDLQRQTLAAIQSLTTTLQGVTDRTTATSAMSKIQDGAKEMDRLAVLSTQLPAETRRTLANATKDQLGRLNTMLDNAAALPGVGPMLQPTVTALRGRMDAIAMVPGKPLFFANAPADWMLLSSFYNRDVQNRAGERVGTASGFFIGPDGKIVASLVSVDRQLGIGEKQIAMPFSGDQLVRKDGNWHLVVDTTKDDMQRAKSFFEPASK
jgi:hypothetical protein